MTLCSKLKKGLCTKTKFPFFFRHKFIKQKNKNMTLCSKLENVYVPKLVFKFYFSLKFIKQKWAMYPNSSEAGLLSAYVC